ncbi:MAG: aminomethyl-transferring glycine dehydrogenase subunit GcvPB [Acidimicrobiales bacterium]
MTGSDGGLEDVCCVRNTGAAAGGRASGIPLTGKGEEPLVFSLSIEGRIGFQLPETGVADLPVESILPTRCIAEQPPALPEVSERDLVGHFTRLTHRQYSVDLGFYPLGSCTMKYNPKAFDEVASLATLADVHPMAPAYVTQGWMDLLWELEQALCRITGMSAFTLQPPAGAAGELTGLLMVHAYHRSCGRKRSVILIPESAHGTNPASARAGGFTTRTVTTNAEGCVDLASLEAALSDDVAAIMLTNPNTIGIFERDVERICKLVHDVGALTYYDGANLNAIMSISTPARMGFDIVHLNAHKTFGTPHGGGGPGAGPVGVRSGLEQFLPGPRPVPDSSGGYKWDMPEHSIGRVHSHHGNALVLARALAYILSNGGNGLKRVSQVAVLNANWLLNALSGTFKVPYGDTCMHECVLSASEFRSRYGIRASDIAKMLLDRGFHPPTISFPLVVDEAMMIEPTETESLQTLQAFASAMVDIAREIGAGGAAAALAAPENTPVGRVDETRAARNPVVVSD